MMRHPFVPRLTRLAVTAVTLAVGGSALPTAALAAAPGGTPSNAYQPKITWGTCPKPGQGGGEPPVERDERTECGQLEVPVDWSDPGGAKINLAVARLKATDPAQRKGVLMWGPGGPGLQGASIIGVYDRFSKDVAAAYDVIGYDSRGLGANAPRCDKPAAPPMLPASKKEFDQRAAYNRALGESCRQKTGALMDHLDSDSDARDMDALRRALGEEKLNYQGASYGTVRGLAYARLFPQHTGRFNLDSSLDPRAQTSFDKFAGDETAAAERNVRAFLTWWREKSKDKPKQDPLTIYRKAQDNARKKGGRYVEDFITSATVGSSSPYGWPDFSKELTGRADGTVPGEPGKPVPYDPGAQAIFCSDWRGGDQSWDAYRAMLDRLKRENPLVGISSQAFSIAASPASCIGWPGKDRESARTDPPAGAVGQVIGVRNDARTSYTWSRDVARRIGASLLTVNDYGHAAYFPATGDGPKSCVTKWVDDYLLTGKKGSSQCAAE
ncbi:alpha/beta fold hydrolase [Streptomyces sp. NPDC001941]|uniref:alpha/beta fold hydrolase n=1 Tax=Streptomyces sp. NPDC001941 TaxID=3154659 RepID=UPI00332A8334